MNRPPPPPPPPSFAAIYRRFFLSVHEKFNIPAASGIPGVIVGNNYQARRLGSRARGHAGRENIRSAIDRGGTETRRDSADSWETRARVVRVGQWISRVPRGEIKYAAYFSGARFREALRAETVEFGFVGLRDRICSSRNCRRHAERAQVKIDPGPVRFPSLTSDAQERVRCATV